MLLKHRSSGNSTSVETAGDTAKSRLDYVHCGLSDWNLPEKIWQLFIIAGFKFVFIICLNQYRVVLVARNLYYPHSNRTSHSMHAVIDERTY